LAIRPTVSIIKLENGYGYILDSSAFKIKQDHAPAMSGIYIMDETESTQLANFIADKIENDLSWSVSIDQILSLWNGIKTTSQLITEEKETMNG
jgi:hypothetical protein